MKKVICIMGPTASGKTGLSIKLAKALNGEVINGDSVQIYQELNIGSAKIKQDEQEGIKHHLLSINPLAKPYTVYNFQQDVRNLLNKIDVPMIVGGSGLYIKSALYNYEFEAYDEAFVDVSHEEKVEAIKLKDPTLDIDFSNVRRVNSAYKQILAGSKRSEKIKKDEALYDIFLIYLDIDRTVLKERLKYRLDQMIEEGFIDEVKGLMDYELNIIGYREIKSYLLGQVSLEEAKEKIIQVSMRFAKKQKTWFKNQMKPNIYDALSPTLFLDVLNDVKTFLEKT
ncbi:tRNA (adenosine(37)-N6)-dimethylallyltransferase MiaA [Acholeplasma equirhinis]|uniref:tRNA (adenosine(37)-N6)-dimethylallyltransferase MiaA n=1 Tax=Acholeplasma equirhinis TaxID=555393 RepID=UPI00197A87AF|nr:tRNA (adenosine(37)-N6)-dimethylallyltransferase MiaA [Acholeplasma equirhinis]MBN3490568.1 tRNA (adenosine(37)-N6)-dimethylallyltransferase MiaA [Acholeplasma equirhinis]